MTINIWTLINQFHQFGITESDGNTRLVYSQSWIDAQKEIIRLMDTYKLHPTLDQIGNVYGYTQKDDPAILVGSHIDTVENGGKFDGILGVLLAIVAVGELVEEFGKPKVPLAVIAFSEEEGSRFDTSYTGSKYFTHQLDSETFNLLDKYGVRFDDARRQALSHFGMTPSEDSNMAIAHFIEPHIEQGQILEQRHVNIGMVTHIVGQERGIISVSGKANHAGTTPMSLRDDAVVKAVTLMNQIFEALKSISDLRYTVGYIEVSPNVGNVIASQVNFSLDMRHHDEKKLKKAVEVVENILKANHANYQTSTSSLPVLMDKEFLNRMRKVASHEQLDWIDLSSGAGHDSVVMSEKYPTNMFFLPSIEGTSHTPNESTSKQDVNTGLTYLKKLLKTLAY